MKRVGLTQRSHAVEGYKERRDMLDQRWAVLIEELGGCALPLSNSIRDVDAYLDALALDALILTGGNDLSIFPKAADIAPERDRFETKVYHYFVQSNKPVLGVCRGAQLINHLCCGKLVQTPGHVNVHHKLVWSDTLPAWWDRPLEVNSYHDWAIPPDGLGLGLEALACAPDGTVEAFQASKGKVTAILWHPERDPELATSTLEFLRKALELTSS